MCAEAVTEKDRTPAVIPAVRPSMPWRVVEATALPDYRLSVRFLDGLVGFVDMTKLVTAPDAGAFAQLRDPGEFARVTVEHGAVTWPSEIDLAPDAMHAAIKDRGEWIVTP